MSSCKWPRSQEIHLRIGLQPFVAFRKVSSWIPTLKPPGPPGASVCFLLLESNEQTKRRGWGWFVDGIGWFGGRFLSFLVEYSEEA